MKIIIQPFLTKEKGVFCTKTAPQYDMHPKSRHFWGAYHEGCAEKVLHPRLLLHKTFPTRIGG